MGSGEQEMYRHIVELLEDWRPRQAYDTERKFQIELLEYLKWKLNNNGEFPGDEDPFIVSSDNDSLRGDIVVNDTVAIELKYDFSTSQEEEFQDQLEEYADNYPFIIVCSCDVGDRETWQEFENTFANRQDGSQLDQTEFTFIYKPYENFGTGSGNDGQVSADDTLLGEL